MPPLTLDAEQLDDGVLCLTLSGRFDVEAAMAIDMKFTLFASIDKAAIVVDMSNVSFLASMGIRTLLSGAKGGAARGGRMVLFNPQPLVAEVLHASGVASLIPIYQDLALARTAALGLAAH